MPPLDAAQQKHHPFIAVRHIFILLTSPTYSKDSIFLCIRHACPTPPPVHNGCSHGCCGSHGFCSRSRRRKPHLLLSQRQRVAARSALLQRLRDFVLLPGRRRLSAKRLMLQPDAAIHAQSRQLHRQELGGRVSEPMCFLYVKRRKPSFLQKKKKKALDAA